MSQVLIDAGRPLDPMPPEVLLACAEGEGHSLPADALAAALAECRVSGCVLGPRVPRQALARPNWLRWPVCRRS